MNHEALLTLADRLEGACDVLQAIANGDVLFSAPNAAPGKELLFSDIRAGVAVIRSAVEPIDMLLNCPRCGVPHIDAPEPGRGWTNPPHKSHLCHGCGCIWRPADVATNGVARIATRGSADTVASSWNERQSEIRDAVVSERERCAAVCDVKYPTTLTLAQTEARRGLAAAIRDLHNEPAVSARPNAVTALIDRDAYEHLLSHGAVSTTLVRDMDEWARYHANDGDPIAVSFAASSSAGEASMAPAAPQGERHESEPDANNQRSLPQGAPAASFVIWSGEHRCWWRADASGYTRKRQEAGRYTLEEAEKHLAGCGPEKLLRIEPAGAS